MVRNLIVTAYNTSLRRVLKTAHHRKRVLKKP
jgi:hypothetical protein